jgi:hypothetical protein
MILETNTSTTTNTTTTNDLPTDSYVLLTSFDELPTIS